MLIVKLNLNVLESRFRISNRITEFLYNMSLSRNSIIFCLVGPAGSGKTSLAKRLIETPNSNLKKLVSATSRSPRPGEVDGVNYKFMTRTQFEDAIAHGEFFEWEEIHGNLYGQLRSSVEQAIISEFDTILDIDISGARSVEQRFPDETVVIFLLPPSKDALKERIIARAPIAQEELAKRMATAEFELECFRKTYKDKLLVDFFLVNSVFEDTLAGLWNIIKTERQRLSRVKPEAMQVLLS